MSLQKYTGSDLNHISNKIETYLNERKLKPGQMAKYRLTNGIRNIDPQRMKGNDVLFPAVVGIPLKTSFYDTGDEESDNARVVEIGKVKSIDDRTKQMTFQKFYIQPQKGDGGIFNIRGGVVSEMEIYEILELHNWNGSNPFRDVSEPIVFERIDDAKESRARSNRRNFLFDSLNAIKNWTPEEVRIMGAAYNLNSSLDLDVIKDALESIAEKNPEEFYNAIDSEDNKVNALIKLATDSGVISYNAHENKYSFAGGETVALLERVEGRSEIDQFREFLKSSANGAAIQGTLQKLIKANNKKK